MKRSRNRLFERIAVGVAGLSIAGGASTQDATDERAIRDLIESHSVALNNGDVSSASAVFSDDATVVTNSGQIYRGRAGIETWHAEAVNWPVPLIHTHPPETMHVYFLNATAAIVDLETVIPRPPSADGQPSSPVRVPLVVAVVERDGQWKVAAQRPTTALPDN